jgi:peroxiredoxin
MNGIPPAPAPGDPAPDFSLPADDRQQYSLIRFRGKSVVLAFYVFDFTGG